MMVALPTSISSTVPRVVPTATQYLQHSRMLRRSRLHRFYKLAFGVLNEAQLYKHVWLRTEELRQGQDAVVTLVVLQARGWGG
jgi:hypothetical protein